MIGAQRSLTITPPTYRGAIRIEYKLLHTEKGLKLVARVSQYSSFVYLPIRPSRKVWPSGLFRPR